jgi:hypothetical protein
MLKRLEVSRRWMSIGILLALLGGRAVNAQSRLDAAKAKAADLDKQAAKVDPSSRDADRIYREAAQADRNVRQIEAQEKQARENAQREFQERWQLGQDLRRENQRSGTIVNNDRNYGVKVAPQSPTRDTPARNSWEGYRDTDRYQQGRSQEIARGNPTIQIRPNVTPQNRQQNDLLSRDRERTRRMFMPTPAPPITMRGREYYVFRDADARLRNPVQGSPDYYSQYALKYFDRFEVLRHAPDTSPALREFLSNVGPRLQQRIENVLRRDPANFARLERSPDVFREFAYSTHPSVYYECGWARLDTRDQIKVIQMMHLGDLVTVQGGWAALRLAPGMLPITVPHAR